jgi:hypothetical protein
VLYYNQKGEIDMKTYPKQFRLSKTDLLRLYAIQENLMILFPDEKWTTTDALKYAIKKACPRIFIDQEEGL